jgi:flavin-dependent dehydrogenase
MFSAPHPCRCDVLVAGGGPAGSAFAIAAARRGASVLLVERDQPPFKKVCGEFLSHGGMELWRKLTMAEPPAGAPRIARVRFFTHARAAAPIPIEPSAWGFSRAALDGGLLDAAARQGVFVRTGARLVAAQPARDVTICELAGAAGEERVEARKVVVATGRPTGARRSSKLWIGRKAICPTVPLESADLDMLLLPMGGYVGVSPIETGEMSVCALSRDGGDAWLTHPSLRGAPVVIGRSVAGFRLGLQPLRADAYCVGDAMAVWPPLVGDGITAAMASGAALGELLGQALAAGRELGIREWVRAWRRLFGSKLQWALALHAAAQCAVGRSALLRLASASRSVGPWLIDRTRTAP